MGVVRGEQFFTRDEYICTFGSYGRAKFETKEVFIYHQYNATATLKYPFFDLENMPK